MRPSPAPPRARLPLTIALATVISLGLASRAMPLFPAALESYPGDSLRALMVLVMLALLVPRAAPLRLAAAALTISFAVEVLQLYRAPWIEAIRDTTPGRLALGSGFDWIDLLAYTVGVGIGLACDLTWQRMRSR